MARREGRLHVRSSLHTRCSDRCRRCRFLPSPTCHEAPSRSDGSAASPEAALALAPSPSAPPAFLSCVTTWAGRADRA